MSAGFVTQPAANSSAYRPIRFTFRTAATLDLQEKAEVEVQLGDNTPVAKFMADYKTRVPDGTSFRYNFEVDIQSIAQSLTIPLVDVMHPGARISYEGTVFAEAKSSVDLKIVVQFYERAFGVLEPVSGTITSNTITCWPIITQTNESQALATLFINSGARNLLTRTYSTVGIPIVLGQNYSLSIIQPASVHNLFWSQTSKTGTTTTGSITFPGGTFNSGNDDKKILCVNVGPRGLQLLNSTVPVITADTATYFVRLRNSSNQNLSQPLAFQMICQRNNIDIRLAWMNDIGGFDYFTFSLTRSNIVRTSSEGGAIPLTWTSQSNAPVGNKSRFKVNSFRDDIMELESDTLDRLEARWVSYVLNSPEVYADIGGSAIYPASSGITGMFPVVVEDGETLIHDSNQVNGVVIRLRIKLSNPIMTQQI